VVISCAFGSPYEGEISANSIALLCDQLIEAGAACCTLADTTGMATPRHIETLVSALSDRVRTDIGLHLHETRGTALLNAYVAMQHGLARFDTSVGGLGGSPFAAGAAGNLATEDLVYLCDELGIGTGISLDSLREVSRITSEVIGRPVPSRVASAGPRLQLASSITGGF
jgi:hydroxymethylglutaryl-CoA lyase